MKKFTDYAATPKNKDWETLIKRINNLVLTYR